MPQTLLGFDYGRLRTGVAVGQTLTGTASALTTLNARQNKPDWDGIDKLIREWQPDGLVVGVPVHMDGTEQEMTKTARKFGRQLKARYNLPVYEADERLSSAEAEHNLGSGQDKAAIDREAARLILQAWLDEQGMQ
ncbi:Holliday junction resolvase RuvX [Sulfuriflexus mobilis]|uniref:Holliday junction resolvase RuvX n=1 Tax=Sulfuriflexus mobilis TaxID=1811807 RepID=UPI0015583A86|nr:Holliday junction resolvase RuvX [Sulfuriflexus mobilis]